MKILNDTIFNFHINKAFRAAASLLLVAAFNGCGGCSADSVVVQGEVEANEAKVSGKLTARVKEILIKEGDTVQAGQALIILDSPEIEAKYKQASAAEAAARASQSKANTGARKETIEAAKNQWLRAKAAAELAVKTYDRIKKLNEDGVVPAQKLDEAEANRKAAEGAEKAALAQYEMAVRGTRAEDKAAAAALAGQAAGAVSEVKAFMEDTVLRAPISGEVGSILPNVGEIISAGFPAVTIIDLNDIRVTFNLREDLLANIRMGAEFDADFIALGNKTVRLKVNYISPKGDFATWRATKTSGEFDMKSFEVRAVPLDPVDGLRPGMSAVADWDSVVLPKEQKTKIVKPAEQEDK